MEWNLKSFNTKVARRIFTLFIICAILPVTVLALISFINVRKQLNEQSRRLLSQESKTMVVYIYDRLLMLRDEMKFVASNFYSYKKEGIQARSKTIERHLSEGFSELALITHEGCAPLFGHLENLPELSSVEREHLFSGNALLHSHRIRDSRPALFMSVALDPKHPDLGILMGKINQAYLWEAAEGRPPMTEICVLDHANSVLSSSLSGLRSFPSRHFNEMTGNHSGQLVWNHQSTEYLAAYCSMFLKSNFLYPEWFVVLSESTDNVLAPMTKFKVSFSIVVVLSLGLVFFLSVSLIKRNTEPIETLMGATREIAKGSFGHRVSINSRDEFETLGTAFNDMSEKLKETQALLVRAARTSTMGQMAGGIMHEIKQPLTAISLQLQVALMKKPSDDDMRRHLETSLNAVERLNGILAKFRSFSHTSVKAMKSLSLVEVINIVLELFEHELRQKKIDCAVQSDDRLPFILGDSQELQQVISNLLMNAMHALEEEQEDPRRITIKTYSIEDNIFFEIEDNGCGIPEEIRGRIFDPFFTTKGPDKGTGLGMAIVESVLHKHHARIEVESEVGIGTKFRIVFPGLPRKEMS
jgi:signal transduction histidine kinase